MAKDPMLRSLERASTDKLEEHYRQLTGEDPAELPFNGVSYRSELIIRILRAESAATRWALLLQDGT